MADVEIGVSAEGVEDAVGEVPTGDGGGAGGTGGAMAGGGGGAGGGKLGRLLGVIAALLTFAEDILKVVGVVSSILRAFLAPVAVLLLRLLSPVLRGLIKVLPAWYDIMDAVINTAEKLSPLAKVAALLGTLAGGIAGAKIGALAGSIVGGFLGSVVPGLGTAVGAAVGAKIGAVVGALIGGITGGVTLAGIVTAVQNLPGTIAELITNPGQFTADPGEQNPYSGGTNDPDVNRTNVVIEGGYGTFVSGVQRQSGVEQP